MRTRVATPASTSSHPYLLRMPTSRMYSDDVWTTMYPITTRPTISEKKIAARNVGAITDQEKTFWNSELLRSSPSRFRSTTRTIRNPTARSPATRRTVGSKNGLSSGFRRIAPTTSIIRAPSGPPGPAGAA